MIRKTAIASLAALLVMLTALPALARGTRGHGPHRMTAPQFRMCAFGEADGLSTGPIWNDPEMIEALGLTDDQIEALKEAEFGLRERQIDMQAQVARAELDLQKTMVERPLDEANARKAAKKLADLHGKAFLLRVEHKLSLHKILSPEQIEKIEKARPSATRERRKMRRRVLRSYEADGEAGE